MGREELNEASEVVFAKPYEDLEASQKKQLLNKSEIVEWIADGNVVRMDGVMKTQDAMYRNSIKSYNELREYFNKHVKF